MLGYTETARPSPSLTHISSALWDQRKPTYSHIIILHTWACFMDTTCRPMFYAYTRTGCLPSSLQLTLDWKPSIAMSYIQPVNIGSSISQAIEISITLQIYASHLPKPLKLSANLRGLRVYKITKHPRSGDRCWRIRLHIIHDDRQTLKHWNAANHEILDVCWLCWRRAVTDGGHASRWWQFLQAARKSEGYRL